MNMTTVVNLRTSAYDVYIGRPSIFGNPFIIGVHGTRVEVIAMYRTYIHNHPELLPELEKLRGKRLGCFCKPLPCHGDVLVELLEASPKGLYTTQKGTSVR